MIVAAIGIDIIAGKWKTKMEMSIEAVMKTEMRSMLMSSRIRYLGLKLAELPLSIAA